MAASQALVSGARSKAEEVLDASRPHRGDQGVCIRGLEAQGCGRTRGRMKP
jgi:hypothetical protein